MEFLESNSLQNTEVYEMAVECSQNKDIWKLERVKYCSPFFINCSETLLLCLKRNSMKIPKPLISLILRDYFYKSFLK